MKINSFTDLNAWQVGQKLALDVYKTTKDFPKEELFGLTSQMRRAAVSVPSNLAEGFHPRKKYNFTLLPLVRLQNYTVKYCLRLSSATFQGLMPIY